MSAFWRYQRFSKKSYAFSETSLKDVVICVAIEMIREHECSGI
jgi:hypothetical protein